MDLMKEARMFEINAQRLLKDSEIIEAIKKGLIVLDKPEVYLKKRRDDLIQPASMDLILMGADTLNPINGVVPYELDYLFPVPTHPDLNQDFVTFWPGYETETSVRHLRWYDGDMLVAQPELRSTLRRVGLDIGFNPYGVGFGDDGFGFLYVRNPQKYPVSIKKGKKIAQVIWKDIGLKEDSRGLGYTNREPKLGSGRMITTINDIISLIEEKDVFISDRASIGDGVLLFHAGKSCDYYNNGPVVISDIGVTGFAASNRESNHYVIRPGEFSDIETREKISLSDRVAMQVFYYSKPIHKTRTRRELINSFNTFQSSGGWIDPGYGFNCREGAPFSVQRKAFTDPIRINEGDLVARGVLWFFDKPVEKPYSNARGSHYSEEIRPVGPRI